MTSLKDVNLNREKVSKAVEALVQMTQKSGNDKSILSEINEVIMQICLKKILSKEKIVELKLPHSLRHQNMDVCLFVKDLEKGERDYEPTVRHFQEMFQKHGISCIAEIIPLQSLKTEYKPFEAKRNLSNAYDLFLADERIVRLLPTYLGKHFYGKKKSPVQVNLRAKDLAAEVQAAMSRSKCVLSNRGSSSVSVVANMQMSPEEITSNVLVAAKQISERLPGGAGNIKQLNLKTKQSKSIPIYMSSGGPQDITLPREATEAPIEAEEISTLFNAKVQVFPNGEIKVIKDGSADEKCGKRKRVPRKNSAQKSKKVISRKGISGRKIVRKGAIKRRKV